MAARAFALLLLMAAPARAVLESPWWWLVPGGGQFVLGENAAGIGYLSSTVGLAAWGAAAEGVRGPGETNAPWLYTQQVYVLGFTSAYRDLRLRLKDKNGPPVDPSPTAKLISAPFRWEVAKSPWVWGSLAAGIGVNLALLKQDTPSYRRLARMRYLGARFNKTQSLPAYSAYWGAASLGAAAAEETLFRGSLQNDLEGLWGRAPGLLAASALFGLAHLTRLNSADSWSDVGFAAGGGLIFGWRYEETGYHLAQPIAQHFWFDLGAGLAVFLANPRQNPLGARVEYGF